MRQKPLEDGKGNIVSGGSVMVCLSKKWCKVPDELVVGNAPKDGRVHACYTIPAGGYWDESEGVKVPAHVPVVRRIGIKRSW